MKHIVICCDGTWQGLDSLHPTNVLKIARFVAAETPEGAPQIVAYDDGVGMGEGPIKALDRLLGGGLGVGLKKNIEEAYRFLVFNYSPGDRIFVFGFSRGAYTARSLVGMIRNAGVLPRASARAVPAALALYKDRDPAAKPIPSVAYLDAAFEPSAQSPSLTERFLAEYGSRRPSIAFLGVWDTVGALGVPTGFIGNRILNEGHRFHDTDLSKIVERAAHAVAADEKRRTFKPVLWSEKDVEARRPNVVQEWFPGVHASVGGGEEERGIADLAFQWMMEQAAHAGLAVARDAFAPPEHLPNPFGPFNQVRSFLFALGGGYAPRTPPPESVASAALKERIAADREYRESCPFKAPGSDD